MRAVLAVAILSLSACAAEPPQQPERYLTPEEDAHLGELCRPYDAVGGCVAIPVPQFRQLLDAARKNRGLDT